MGEIFSVSKYIFDQFQDVLAPRILGREVQPTVISEELYSFSRDFGQRGTYVEAISGIGGLQPIRRQYSVHS